MQQGQKLERANLRHPKARRLKRGLLKEGRLKKGRLRGGRGRWTGRAPLVGARGGEGVRAHEP